MDRRPVSALEPWEVTVDTKDKGSGEEEMQSGFLINSCPWEPLRDCGESSRPLGNPSWMGET